MRKILMIVEKISEYLKLRKEFLYNLGFIIAAIIFLFLGARAGLHKNDSMMWGSYIVGCFFVFFTFLGRFKHFKLFGFAEAEMWEDKQKEAQDIIQTFKKQIMILSESVAISMGGLGRFSTAIPSNEKISIVEKLRVNLREQNFPEIKIKEVLQPFDRLFALDVAREFILNDIRQFLTKQGNLSKNHKEEEIFQKELGKFVPSKTEDVLPKINQYLDQLNETYPDFVTSLRKKHAECFKQLENFSENRKIELSNCR